MLALGGVIGDDAGSIVFGIACGVGAGALFYFRRPAEVAVTLMPVSGGTEVVVLGGPDAERVKAIVQTVAAG
jgi:hypothetical protein